MDSAFPNPENPTCEADDPLMDPTSSYSQTDPLREQELVPPPTPDQDALHDRESLPTT